MKKLFLLMMLIVPAFAFSQQIVSKQEGIKDLKDLCTKYTKVVIQTAGFKIHANVGVESGGIWEFYDDKTEKPKSFATDLDVLNYMYENGWRYVDKTNNGNMQNYIFEKIES